MLQVLTGGDGSLDRPVVLISDSPRATEQFGCLLASVLPPNAVISLEGDLGSGKTLLTRGLACGIGCLGSVSSPTFTLLMEHPAAPEGLALYHFDAYRLEGPEAFLELGLDEYFDAGGICAIEWGDRVAGLLPERTMVLRLSRTEPARPEERRIVISWPGAKTRLDRLQALMTQEGMTSCCPEQDQEPCPGDGLGFCQAGTGSESC